MQKKIIVIVICLTLVITTFLIVSAKNPIPKVKDYLELPPIIQPDAPDDGFIVYCDVNDGNIKSLDEYGSTTSLTHLNPPIDANIRMEDVEPCGGVTDYGYLIASNVAEVVGSCKVTLQYNPSEVTIIDVDDGDFETMIYYDDGAGTLSIVVFNYGTVLNGDFNIARIEFGEVGSTGCPLIIVYSELFTADNLPDKIPHTRYNGYADTCPGSITCDGDMNGDGTTNSADVRYLGLHIAGDPLYNNLYAEGDVNGEGSINSADVRYLAKYYVGDPLYNPLCPI